MQSVKITTTQNVDIEHEIASVGDRILAALIDLAIQLGYIIGATIIFSEAVKNESGAFVVAFFILLYLPVFCYDLLCETLMDGQSFGKKQMKIKVIKLDGSQPGLGSYLLRWLFRLIDVGISTGGVAILTLLLNGKGQRLGDIAAGTTVIKLKSRITLDDTIFAKLQEDYEAVFPQVTQLSDEDISTVKEVLNARVDERISKVSYALALKTKKALEAKMGINVDMHPRAFLQTVLKDYNYYKGKV
jgi:uncharacterized RDD family membrane protein YckC